MMLGTCSVCGNPTRFNSFRCQNCRSAGKKKSASAADPVLDEALDVSPPTRFRVERIEAPSMVFSVVDTLTNTIREVTNDPLDAADIAGRLNDGFVYAYGARWRAPA